MSTHPIECSGKIVAVAANAGAITTPKKGIWCGTAGTLTFVDETGATVTNFPMQVGHNPIRVTSLTSGTASGLFALY